MQYQQFVESTPEVYQLLALHKQMLEQEQQAKKVTMKLNKQLNIDDFIWRALTNKLYKIKYHYLVNFIINWVLSLPMRVLLRRSPREIP